MIFERPSESHDQWPYNQPAEGLESQLTQNEIANFKIYMYDLVNFALEPYVLNHGSMMQMKRTLRSDQFMVDVSADIVPIVETGGADYKNIVISLYEKLPYLGAEDFDYVLCEETIWAENAGLMFVVNWHLVNESQEVSTKIIVDKRPPALAGDGIRYTNVRDTRKVDLEAQVPKLSAERLWQFVQRCDQVVKDASEDAD